MLAFFIIFTMIASCCCRDCCSAIIIPTTLDSISVSGFRLNLSHTSNGMQATQLQRPGPCNSVSRTYAFSSSRLFTLLLDARYSMVCTAPSLCVIEGLPRSSHVHRWPLGSVLTIRCALLVCVGPSDFVLVIRSPIAVDCAVQTS